MQITNRPKWQKDRICIFELHMMQSHFFGILIEFITWGQKRVPWRKICAHFGPKCTTLDDYW